MICAKCGANNPPESAYCGGCGSFLASAPDVATRGSAPQQASPALSESEPQAQSAASVREDMPTFHSMEPIPQQDRPAVPVEEVPTVRGEPAQPTPSANELQRDVPASPTPDLSSNVYQEQAPGYASPQQVQASGASYPQQGQAPGYSSGAQQGQMPGYVNGASYPQQGQVPGYSSGASYPQQGQVPGYPSGALYPPQPMPFPPQTPQPAPGVYPPQTPLPGYVSGTYPVQGQPSGVYPPTVGEFPAGVYPSPFPGQPSQAGWGPYGTSGVYAPSGVPQDAKPSKLINPLPLWAFIASIVVVAALLLLLTFFAGSDWAAGAQTAGIVALVIGVLILIAFGVRAGLGMLVQTNRHRRSQIISSLLLTLLLIAVGAFGLTQQMTMHNLQGRTLEGQQKWQAAINEYQAAGQGAPDSEDIARTYNEWGSLLLTQGQIDNAITKFDLVYNTYGQAHTGAAQAKNDAISAYQGEAAQASQKQDYVSATKHYDALLGEAYCQNDHACQSQYSAADATAYYKLAEQKLNLQPPDYTAAVAAFSKLTTTFTSSPESQTAHADYAKALWGDGQQLLNTTCASALPLYQQLSSTFSDTPQGKQASTALQQPESVKGQFSSNIPGSPEAATVGLVQGTAPGMTSDQFYAILLKAPLTNVKSDGSFVFKPVKQGNYYLVWGSINTSTGAAIFYNAQQYPAAVGPLCTLDMGQINESFPNA